MPERAFLDAIASEPDDDTHRLIFADWLDDHGQSERAEFIRAQIELARLDELDPRRTDLEIRERQLLAAHAAEWAAPWSWKGNREYADPRPRHAVFRRGFLESVGWPGCPSYDRLDEEAFAALFAAHPVRDVNLDGLEPESLEVMAGRDETGRIEGLCLHPDLRRGQGHDPEWRRQPMRTSVTFLRSPHLRQVRRLRLEVGMLNDDETTEWLDLPALAGLESLSVPLDASIDGLLLRALARRNFPRLTELHLTGLQARVPDRDAIEELIRSPLWGRVRALTLANAPRECWREILRRARLRRLCFEGGPTSREALVGALCGAGAENLEELEIPLAFSTTSLARVLGAGSLVRLRRLTITRNGLENDELECLARSPVLGNLEWLELGNVLDAERGVTALLGSHRLARLTRLRFTSGLLHVAAAEALARNPNRGRLRVLGFAEATGPAALAALTEGEPFPDLHTLQLSHWREPDPAALDALLNSPKLPRLCVFDFAVAEKELEKLAPVLRACDRLAWAGGEMSHDEDGRPYGYRVSVSPETVYLPHHLDDL